MVKWMLVLVSAFFSLETMSQTPAIKVLKSTKQITLHGAAPGSTSTYRIEFKKVTKNEIRIDSVLTVADLKKIDFYLFKKKAKTEIPFNEFVIPSKEKSVFIIVFGQTIMGDLDRRGRAAETEESRKDFSKGVIIYYKNGIQPETLKVTDFKMIEEVHAP